MNDSDKRQAEQKSKEPQPGTADEVQGEGNREADRRYRKATREFVESGQAEQSAEPAPASPEERRELENAERTGRKKAKEKDPAVTRDYTKPA